MLDITWDISVVAHKETSKGRITLQVSTASDGYETYNVVGINFKAGYRFGSFHDTLDEAVKTYNLEYDKIWSK